MADERPGQTRMRHDEADSSIQIHSILPFVKIERRTSRGDRDVTPLSNTYCIVIRAHNSKREWRRVLTFVPTHENEKNVITT